jgi:hypothetical protein
MRVAASRSVTRSRSGSRQTDRPERASQILLTAGPIRQRAATADAPRGAYSRPALGVGSPTLPPLMPSFVQDDGPLRFSAELFIVFRSAPGGESSFVTRRTAASRNGRMSSTRVLRCPWAVALVIFLVSDGTARPGQAPFGNSDDLRGSRGPERMRQFRVWPGAGGRVRTGDIRRAGFAEATFRCQGSIKIQTERPHTTSFC